MSQQRIRFGNFVQKGLRSGFWSDIYFHLMEGSSVRLVALITVGYLIANLIFAGLYLLGGECVVNVRAGNFWDAFYFSVQTMSTIGYGAMSPTTAYAHVVVTAEALTGLLGFAMATGLMFAKLSRPRANILFSARAVVTRHHGVLCLLFRAANARGNEVLEASMRIAALVEDVSPEGHHMRRLVDLDLRRHRTPIFTISWLVMHEIDSESPLYGLDADSAAEDLPLMLIVTLTGLDATYAQTIHARHIYYPSDIRWHERFVDVLTITDSGQVQIDYTHFHDTEPDLPST